MCVQVLNVSVESLVALLDFHLFVDDMSSAESWKLLLTRVSHLLDVALIQLSNQVQDRLIPVCVHFSFRTWLL